MEGNLLSVAYLAASVLFILSLRGLASQETARRGNLYGLLGMAIAVLATLTSREVTGYVPLAVAIGVASVLGALLAARVAMTAMPELVAILHSFVGLAAVLVGFSSYLGGGAHGGEPLAGTAAAIWQVEIFLDVFIGAVTFTGSVVAFGKLRGTFSGRPLLLPGRHALNLLLVFVCLGLAVLFVGSAAPGAVAELLAVSVLAGLLGIHLVMAIGGADMPVVVSMLNSYSGWTAAAAGFMLGNDLLIVTGALVGSSGAILSIIMCRAMNRSILNVLFGGFGTQAPAAGAAAGPAPAGELRDITPEETARVLAEAKRVVVVPGYGMAVARAQHVVRELTEVLRARGVDVRFAIHPVAGRLPGHMNVLLAEANVPYGIVEEMDEIQPRFPETDVSLVIGANDIVNPGAETDPGSPIFGMPVIQVWKAKTTVMCKRSRGAGYAGVDNPLFYHERTRMLFGDAREAMERVVAALKRA